MKTLEMELGQNSYSIFIEKGIMNDIGKRISKLYSGEKIVLITDDNVNKFYGEKIEKNIKDSGYDVFKIVIKAGEKSKNIKTLTDIYSRLAEFRITRSDLIVTLGGGVVGDIGGFAAATYLRGISYIQIPTSLLAQIDSSIGGKVAVDLEQGKNLVGNFYQPKAVFIDPLFLKTLDIRFLHDGMGEVIKYGAIRDGELFKRLEEFKDDNELMDNIEYVIHACCRIKKQVVENDEKDNGERMILNFGHTIGHAVEEFFHYEKFTHGECVAYGMYSITKNSERLGITKEGTTEKLKNIVKKYSLPFNIDNLKNERIYEIAALDKKSRGKFINLVLLKDIGDCFIEKVESKETYKYLRVV
ncbi:3-dehydroquinate synthase [Clostridium acetobutylicum]|nr:3-dehydroquinate synthase [Clostridium acetobutylicum]